MSDFASMLRLWQSARILARYDALLPGEYRAKLPFRARAARAILGIGRFRETGPPGTRLARALERLGPAYIKLGQMLATRPDIVGEELARALEHLQDRLPPFSDAAARTAIADSLGRPVESLFSIFGAPVAAASIAQVHRATTSGGADAAVKVLRPGIEALFRRDLEALALFARLAERFSVEARRLRLNWICAWKPLPRPSSMTARGAMRNSACRMWTGPARRRGCSPANGSTVHPSAMPRRSGRPDTIQKKSHSPWCAAFSPRLCATAFSMPTCIRAICSWTVRAG
jgi:hypothetical protein